MEHPLALLAVAARCFVVALAGGLAGLVLGKMGRRIADGYRRTPPATPDAWGDLAAMTDQATVDLLQRLDAEKSDLW